MHLLSPLIVELAFQAGGLIEKVVVGSIFIKKCS